MNQYNSNLQWCSLLENSVDLDDENGIETESNFLFNKQSNKKLKRVNSQEYLSLHNRKQFDNFSENNGFSKDESLQSKDDAQIDFVVQYEIQKFVKQQGKKQYDLSSQKSKSDMVSAV